MAGTSARWSPIEQARGTITPAVSASQLLPSPSVIIANPERGLERLDPRLWIRRRGIGHRIAGPRADRWQVTRNDRCTKSECFQDRQSEAFGE